MEWLGVLLLYLISGFIKKRQQNLKRREIESDPEWDSEKTFSENIEESSNPLDQMLNDLFENNPKTPEQDPSVRKAIKNVNAEPLSKQKAPVIEESPLDKNKEDFDEKSSHSDLSERSEQHLGNKWEQRANIQRNLFSSQKEIKKSIITKEVLDKPLALRK
ncbi:hypothetical protein OA955_01080 [Candidatus Marinimicrobia bacterium]|nr:hypothetical protein [Candidatus Neomarinimicrobiota bacterium]